MPSDTLTSAVARQDPSNVDQPTERPVGPVGLLNSPAMLEQIQESLPGGMDAAAFKRHAITLVKQTPKLMECEATSVAQGIVRGAALGLDPDPALGQMWLVPRSTKVTEGGRDRWIQVATFQVGYRGLYELAMRTGRIAKIEVKAVHEHDHFEARLGSNGGLDHRPDWFGDRGKIVGWYAYALQKDGAETFEVLSVADAEAHREQFAPRKSSGNKAVYGPWVDHFEAMAMKTVFIKLAKWLPKQVEVARALEVDGTAVLSPLGGHVLPGDVIEATHSTVGERPALAAAPDPDDDGDDELPPAAVTSEPGLPLADENGEPIEATATAEPNDAATEGRNRKMWALVTEVWADRPQAEQDLMRKHLIKAVSNGATTSSKQLDAGQWDDLFIALDSLNDGSMELFQRATGDYELRNKPQKSNARKATR